MKINQNMSAVRANNQLLRTEDKLAASIERLSSGYKLNKPKDNPAGMAISNKMRAQIDALDQAESNVSDATSVMQIADGALNEVTSVLQRMRELAVQAGNDTYSYSDKQSIQAEIDELKKEVDRISTDTEYNQKTLLDGSSNTRVYTEPNVLTRMDVSENVTAGQYTINVVSPAETAVANLDYPTTMADGSLSINGISMKTSASMTIDEFLTEFRNVAEQAGCTASWNGGALSVESIRYGSNAVVNMEFSASIQGIFNAASAGNAAVNEDGSVTLKNQGVDAVATLPTDTDVSGFSDTATISADGNHISITDYNGFSIDFLLNSDYTGTADAANGNVTLDITDIGTMTIQTGGNQYQEMNITIREISSKSLYLDEVDVSVAYGAGNALETLDKALAHVSEVRSKIGAFQNRLEYATGSLAETNENMTAAISNLMDTDMATEMVEYTQQTVLEQAATSVLSQANDLPQTVLSLLQK